MDIFTVCFFGHREVDDLFEIEELLDRILREIITQKEFTEFLIGCEGEFDMFASSCIKRAIRKYSCGNTFFTLILPYQKAEYKNNEQDYLKYYDEIEICAKSAAVHFKSAITVRNRYMVDRSDLILCYVKRKGGAYTAMQYAKREGKRTVNLADLIKK